MATAAGLCGRRARLIWGAGGLQTSSGWAGGGEARGGDGEGGYGGGEEVEEEDEEAARE